MDWNGCPLPHQSHWSVLVNRVTVNELTVTSPSWHLPRHTYDIITISPSGVLFGHGDHPAGTASRFTRIDQGNFGSSPSRVRLVYIYVIADYWSDRLWVFVRLVRPVTVVHGNCLGLINVVCSSPPEYWIWGEWLGARNIENYVKLMVFS